MTAINTEQAADLAALQAGAAEQQPPGAAQPSQAEQAPQEQAPPSAAALQMAAMAVGMVRPLISYAVASLRDAPDQLWEPIPEGLARLMDHYGASADWMQNPWAQFGISVTPLVAYAAIKGMEEKPKPQQQQLQGPDLSAKPPAEPVGQKTVTFGAPEQAAA